MTSIESPAPADFARVLAATSHDRARTCPTSGLRIALDPDDVKKGLGRLVLTLVELIRDLLERQAVRRVEAGSLTDAEIERLGSTFLQLSEQMVVLKNVFGLEAEDLNLDLGPLGKLLDDIP